MTARTAVKIFGENLLGKTIFTPPFGDWKGGQAKVTELYPDPDAPEIVMTVKSVEGHGEIGVFGNETISIIINEPREFDDLRGH